MDKITEKWMKGLNDINSSLLHEDIEDILKPVMNELYSYGIKIELKWINKFKLYDGLAVSVDNENNIYINNFLISSLGKMISIQKNGMTETIITDKNIYMDYYGNVGEFRFNNDGYSTYKAAPWNTTYIYVKG
jgi:hypothetical protein